MIIHDPRTNKEIDVTGWDLDKLAQIIAGVREAIETDPGGNLTDVEVEALSGPYGLPEIEPVAAWDYDAPEVADAVERYGEIVREAIFQRDLVTALEGLSTNRALTGPERAAYDEYVRELVYAD